MRVGRASLRPLLHGKIGARARSPRLCRLAVAAAVATNAAPAGDQYLPSSQRLYDKGCVRFESAYVGNDNRFVDVWLYAPTAPRLLPTNQLFPPAGAFHP